MRDLIDVHRANIAKAGVALAEAINEATTVYTLAVAASEAELDVQMERRVAAFHGAQEGVSPSGPIPVKLDGEIVGTFSSAGFVPTDIGGAVPRATVDRVFDSDPVSIHERTEALADRIDAMLKSPELAP